LRKPDVIVEFSQILTAIILGLFAGSLLTEAMVLVPYWRAMEPEAFIRLHSSMGPRLYRYFSPITILAALIPTVTAGICIVNDGRNSGLSVAVSVLVLIILGIYFYYFKTANAGFASESPDVGGLSAELRRWAAWHWIRTMIVMVGLVLSLLVLV